MNGADICTPSEKALATVRRASWAASSNISGASSGKTM